NMRVVGGKVRNLRKCDAVGRDDWRQFFEVIVPNGSSFSLDLLKSFKLSKKESCRDFRQKKGRSNVHPSVFVDFAPDKRTSVGSFLPHYLCSSNESLIIDNHKSSLATRDIFRIVKRKAR